MIQTIAVAANGISFIVFCDPVRFGRIHGGFHSITTKRLSKKIFVIAGSFVGDITNLVVFDDCLFSVFLRCEIHDVPPS